MWVDCQWPTPIKWYLDGASHVHTRARNIAFVKDPIVSVKEFSDADHMLHSGKAGNETKTRAKGETGENSHFRCCYSTVTISINFSTGKVSMTLHGDNHSKHRSDNQSSLPHGILTSHINSITNNYANHLEWIRAILFTNKPVCCSLQVIKLWSWCDSTWHFTILTWLSFI